MRTDGDIAAYRGLKNGAQAVEIGMAGADSAGLAIHAVGRERVAVVTNSVFMVIIGSVDGKTLLSRSHCERPVPLHGLRINRPLDEFRQSPDRCLSAHSYPHGRSQGG